MIEIKKAQAEDFEKIYPLLKEQNSNTIIVDKYRWRRLFTHNWDSQEGSFGYILFDNNNAVGFIGTLFSERIINNKYEKLCNLTSWIVKKEYRNESLSLIFPILQLKECTVTVFTPSSVTSSTLKAFGYQEIFGKRVIIPTIPGSGSSASKSSVEYNLNKIMTNLNTNDLKIFYDHLYFRCNYILIKAREGYCYIILRKKSVRKLPLAEIQYISNREIFLKYIRNHSFNIGCHFKIVGLIVNERYVEGQKLRLSATLRPSGPILYKSSTLKKQDIDTLYSELFVLDI